MKHAISGFASSLVLILYSQLSFAQTAAPATATQQVTESSKTAPDMADGEVRKVDPETKKITLRHGVIKNLDMPAMTMVFQVKDPALLANIKAGDKIRFTADKINGAFTVLTLEPRQ